MALTVPPPFTPVSLRWVDAKTCAGETHETVALALSAYKPCIRRVIGLWLGWSTHEGHTAAALATDDDRSEDSPDAVGGISYIPRGMVLSIEPICSPTSKKARKR